VLASVECVEKVGGGKTQALKQKRRKADYQLCGISSKMFY